MRLKGQLLERRLIVRVPKTQAAVAAFSAGPDRTIRGDYKSAILSCLNLQTNVRKDFFFFKWQDCYWKNVTGNVIFCNQTLQKL